jgi:hypothetical protein
MNGGSRVDLIDGVHVVRDDAFPGGTKARCLEVLLRDADEFVYCSPAWGYAQLALALSAQACGKRAVVFTAARRQLAARTQQAAAAGAKIVPVPHGYMSVLNARAREYCASSGARLLPFGLDTPPFIAALAEYAASLALAPREVWCVAGSGVLCRALQIAYPAAEFHAVQVGHLPAVGAARLHRAPERFEQPARHPPPFLSCLNYDAKAWQFVRRLASPGALFWNVAP